MRADELTGRELDAVVAQLMGWQKVPVDDAPGEWCWLAPHGSTRGQDEHPHYSTDIAAAWSVIAELAARRVFVVGERHEKGWLVYFNMPDGGSSKGFDAETAPVAICRAALAAQATAPAR